MLRQPRNRPFGQSQRATVAFALGFHELEFAVYTLERPSNNQRALGEVDVLPPEPESFAQA